MQTLLLLQTGAGDASLRDALVAAGYPIVCEVSEPQALRSEVERTAPDVIIVRTDRPDDALLEALAAVSNVMPRPIVVFARDGPRALIRKAVECGVAAYVVRGWAHDRIVPIIEAAIARFEAFDAMRRELDSTRTKLSERKVIEKAKGIVMAQRKLNEDEAYGALRRMAMDQNLALAEVARRVIAVSQLLV